jgi:multiple sugar transport system substrate-binding protein
MPSLTLQQKILAGAIGAAIIIVALMATCVIPGWKTCDVGGRGTEKLTMWGVYEISDDWFPIFRAFKARYPGVELTYRKVPFDEYENELLNAFAAGGGPDIFYIHHTWLPKFIDKIAPMPQGEGWTTFAQYRDTFVDVVAQDFTRDEKTIYAVPLYMDALALYYNRDLLNAAGIAEPPKTWEEFLEDVERLTVVDATGNIVRAGAALGTARNVNRSTDILALLMLQTFGDMPLVDPSQNAVNLLQSLKSGSETFYPGIEALTFYTNFANPSVRSYTWNEKQHYSIDAFVEGSAAMMLNYSHHIATIRSRAPQLSFGVTRAPQPKALADQKLAVDYANYFGLTVAKASSPGKREAAWKFLEFMMEAPSQKMYAEESGLLPARRDLLKEYANDPDRSPFAQAALTARSWYQPDSDAIEKLLADAIESVVSGSENPRAALDRVAGQISVLLRREKEKDRE